MILHPVTLATCSTFFLLKNIYSQNIFFQFSLDEIPSRHIFTAHLPPNKSGCAGRYACLVASHNLRPTALSLFYKTLNFTSIYLFNRPQMHHRFQMAPELFMLDISGTSHSHATLPHHPYAKRLVIRPNQSDSSCDFPRKTFQFSPVFMWKL